MSLLPGKNNFTAWKGGTWRKVLTLYTGSTITTPVRDLTGYSGQMLITDFDTGAVLKTLTDGNGGVTLGGVSGTITLYISDEDTATETWDNGKYLLTITSPGGDTDPILYGAINIRSE